MELEGEIANFTKPAIAAERFRHSYPLFGLVLVIENCCWGGSVPPMT